MAEGKREGSLSETLTADEVLGIHFALVEHFKNEENPITPPGPRSTHLLESAVSRQYTSSGGLPKYPEPRANAATLLYGICMNHPFHNGNKRTAFVSALIHLDRNGFIPESVTHAEFYNMLLALSDHRLTSASTTPKGGRNPSKAASDVGRLASDEEVKIVAEWLRGRTRKEDKREHPLAFRQLRKILARFGYYLDNPRGNFIDVVREEVHEKPALLGLGRPQKVVRRTRVSQIAYAGEGAMVEINAIKRIRKECRLSPENGIDSRSFYDSESTVDSILNQYRLLLKRLAKT